MEDPLAVRAWWIENVMDRIEAGRRGAIPMTPVQRVMRTIDALDDTELLGIGVFTWTGKYPISRWIPMNTARQYTTARTFIRRALREHHG